MRSQVWLIKLIEQVQRCQSYELPSLEMSHKCQLSTSDVFQHLKIEDHAFFRWIYDTGLVDHPVHSVIQYSLHMQQLNVHISAKLQGVCISGLTYNATWCIHPKKPLLYAENTDDLSIGKMFNIQSHIDNRKPSKTGSNEKLRNWN
ncbi:uncharacterized protein RBU57_004784 isoform 2-T2 [Macrochelys suwanniensis]